MVMRKTGGIIPGEDFNSGSQKFLTGVPPAKPMKVNVGDPHKQAKDEGKGYVGTACCVKRAGK
jgi:hypothetical protein